MPTCDPDKFVNREKELAYIKDKITRLARGHPFAPHERVVHFVGPSGIGKSCLLEKCYETFNLEPKCVPLLIQLETLGRTDKEFVDDFLIVVYKEFCGYKRIPVQKQDGKTRKQFVSYLHRIINVHGKDEIIVLLLDEINVPQRKELQAIEENLLEELLHSNEHVVLITAGRLHPMLNDFALRPSSANTFPLSAFDEKTTGEQLEKLRSGLAPIAGKVLELGGGVPGNNAKLAEHVIGVPPQMPNELQAVQALLTDVIEEVEERFRSIIEAICVLQAFFPEDVAPLVKSHPALGEQWDEASIKDVFPELKQIKIGPGGLINWDREKRSWVMDEPTRALFERELRMRNPELWRKLHCTAYQMYTQWGKELDSQLYKDKADYHQICLRSAGFDFQQCDWQ